MAAFVQAQLALIGALNSIGLGGVGRAHSRSSRRSTAPLNCFQCFHPSCYAVRARKPCQSLTAFRWGFCVPETCHPWLAPGATTAHLRGYFAPRLPSS